jgi:hypothetical protein
MNIEQLLQETEEESESDLFGGEYRLLNQYTVYPLYCLVMDYYLKFL